VTDCFALLNEPRRPWLDADALKRKFLALSAELHPDRVHQATQVEQNAAQARFAEVNTAYSRLRDPKERLKHLLELELGARPAPVQQIPPDLMNLFIKVGGLCRETDAFLAEKDRTTSPLLQVGLFERGQEWTAKLAAIQQEINSRYETLLTELRALDADWNGKPDPARRGAALKRLEELYRLFSYLARWSAQVQERIVRISF
jgi:curved DNA-binding protein CbpA